MQKHIAETQPHYGGTTNHIAAEFDPKKTCLLMDAAKETIILNTWEPPSTKESIQKLFGFVKSWKQKEMKNASFEKADKSFITKKLQT